MTTAEALVIRRAWAMPSAETFTIKPIAELLDRWLEGRAVIVDPFARNSSLGTITNDLNPKTSAQHHLPAEEFARHVARSSELMGGSLADAVLFDPPYSPRQISEVYQAVGLKCGTAETQNGRLYAEVKNALAEVIKPWGIAICCGWNSAGFGKSRGFEMREMLLVAHGSAHNDTIVTVEEKLPGLFEQEGTR